jgi:small conductance mechanosensitive channel
MKKQSSKMIPDLKQKLASVLTLHYLIVGIVSLCYLIISHFVAKWISYKISKTKNNNDEETLKKSTAVHVMKSVIYGLVMIILFAFIGIKGAAVTTLLGSVFLAIGLGLQGTLGDLASGIMLMLSNAFSMGHYIEVFTDMGDDINGTVIKFNILFTTLLDDDSGVTFIVPNRVLYSCPLKNHSTSKTPIVLEIITISNKNLSIQKALENLREAVQNHELVLKDPPVSTNVSSLTGKGTDIEVRYALHPSNYYASKTRNVRSIISTLIRESLIKSGVDLVVRI